MIFWALAGYCASNKSGPSCQSDAYSINELTRQLPISDPKHFYIHTACQSCITP